MAHFKVALVALDGQFVPDWATRQLAGNDIDLVINECTTTAELVALAGDADVVWIFGGSTIVTADSLPDLPRCLAILRTGTGTDNVPLNEATAAGIVVAITPEAGGDAVAEHTVALILAILRQVAVQDRLVRGGVWDRYRAWPRWQLRNHTLGVVGFGSIARSLVHKLQGFEMSVVAYDPFVGPEVFAQYGVRQASLLQVMEMADVVSLHCPLTPETFHLIGERELRAMRSDSILVNTARGPLVDEAALCRALTEGWIGGAGIDVLETEPTDPANPLLRLDNVIITPHIAGYSDTFLAESWRLSVETVIDLSQGRWPKVWANRDVVPRRPLSTPLNGTASPRDPVGLSDSGLSATGAS